MVTINMTVAMTIFGCHDDIDNDNTNSFVNVSNESGTVYNIRE